MNTYLTFSFVFVALLEAATYTSAQLPDVALILACFFSAVLVTWSVRQYDRKFLPLSREKPFHLPLPGIPPDSISTNHRLAAPTSEAAGF